MTAPWPSAGGSVPSARRAGDHQRPAAKRGVGGDDDPERTPDPADLLDRDRVGEGVHSRAAVLLGDRDAEPAHLAAGDGRPRPGMRWAFSCSSTIGATSVSMKSRTVERRSACSGERSKSMPPRVASTRPIGPGASLRAMDPAIENAARRSRREGPSAAVRLASDPPARDPGAAPARGSRFAGPARAGDRREPDRCPAAAAGARGDPFRQPPDGAPWGRRPRHLYDVTADAQELFPSNYDGLARASWPRSARSAARR